jgi:KaiC/GvpD/RAD55 family RecA-like ATPase
MLPDTVLSGIDALDQAWEGLRRGAAYLLYGQARSGRELLLLHLTRTGLTCEERCVLVSSRSAHDLAEQAASIGFDLEEGARRGGVRILRVPAPVAEGGGDEAIERALRDLAALVREEAPDRLLIEDFTPFVRFRQFPRFRQAVLEFLAALAETQAVTVLALGEPANTQSREIVAFLRGQTAGALHLTIDPEEHRPTARRLRLRPPPESTEPERSVAWDLSRLKRSGLAAAHALFSDADLSSEPAGDSAALAAEPTLDFSMPGRPTAESAPEPDEPPSEEEPAPPREEPPRETPQEPPQEAPIRFFDPHDPFGPPPEVEDPFAALHATADLFARAHFVEGRGSDAPPPPAPRADYSPAPELPSEEAPFVTQGRPRFAEAFAAARARTGEPFLLLSFRAEAGVPFDALATGLARAAGPADALLADADRQRLALLLPGRTREAAQGVFRHLKHALREAGAEAALREVSALVLPDGEPFRTAEDFFARAFDAP